MPSRIIFPPEQALAGSVQAHLRDPEMAMQSAWLPLLANLARGDDLLPAWWSVARDKALHNFYRKSDHVSGAFYTLASKLAAVPFIIEARDPRIKSHRELAEAYQILLTEGIYGSGGHSGWVNWATSFLLDLYTTDNGAFSEIVGDGPKDKPIVGYAYGLNHLDPLRCIRTSSPEFPVVYTDTDGSRYKLHFTRVMHAAQLASTESQTHGVGLCWLSRCFNAAQSLVDISTYKQEQFGSRPSRQILLASGGLEADDILEAFVKAASENVKRGNTRYARTVVLGNRQIRDAKITPIPLNKAPEFFSEDEATILAMNTIALTGAVPVRWLWPGTSTGATKADALYSHIAGLTSGPGITLRLIVETLGGSSYGTRHARGHLLPPELKMSFDFQDDEQDRLQADIRSRRSLTRKNDLASKVTDVRTSRQQAMRDGDLSLSQFEDLELSDGRLPDGTSVLSLFFDPENIELFTFEGVDNVLIGPAEPILAEIPNRKASLFTAMHLPRITPNEFDLLKRALVAYEHLEQYWKKLQQEALVEAQNLADLNATPGKPTPDKTEPVPPEIPGETQLLPNSNETSNLPPPGSAPKDETTLHETAPFNPGKSNGKSVTSISL